MAVVVAHRGASKTHPENTVEAFREAVRLGCEWVELDVRSTGDRQLVVHHDPTLPDGRNIVDLSAVELPKSVPSLSAALAACEGIKVNIEIKNDADEPDFDADRTIVEPVVTAALAVMDPADILLSSFDHEMMRRARAHSAVVDTALLFWTEADRDAVVAKALAGGHRSVNAFDALVTPELVQEAVSLGLEVNVWTVDDPDRMAELVSFGVEGIVTNDPETARRVLDAL